MKAPNKHIFAALSLLIASSAFADIDLRPSPNLGEVLRDEHLCLVDSVITEGATPEAAVKKCVRYGFGALRHSAYVAAQKGFTLVPGTEDGDMWQGLAERNATFWLSVALKQCSAGTTSAAACKTKLKLN